MNTIQIQNISISELKSLISNTVEDKIKSLIPEPVPEIKYLTRKEVAELLGISLVTLHHWVKNGVIKAHKIHTRVRFRSDEVEKALKEIESLKYKRR